MVLTSRTCLSQKSHLRSPLSPYARASSVTEPGGRQAFGGADGAVGATLVVARPTLVVARPTLVVARPTLVIARRPLWAARTGRHKGVP